MDSNTERMRQAIAAKRMAMAEKAPPKPAPPPKPKTAPEEKKTQGVVTYSCGHAEPLGQCRNQLCRKCQNAARQAKKAREREKKIRDAAGDPRKGDVTYGRFPDGAEFRVLYDARAGAWTGSLKVPGQPEFTASLTGVFKLLTALDAMYRASLTPPEAT